MCQYRYFFYPSCRHQQSVLVKYCEHATSVPENGTSSSNLPATQTAAEQSRMPHDTRYSEFLRKKRELKKKEGQRQKNGNLPSSTNDHKSPSPDPTHNQIASLPSITDQYSPRTSSSIVPQHEQTSDMAALRPFGLQTFFGGGTKQPPEDDVPAHLADSPTGLGIRDHTNRCSAHIAQGSAYEISEDGSQIRDSFDQIEQEVDALKEEVLRLKTGNANSHHQRGQHVNDAAQPQSSLAGHEALSPAEKLRRQHEQWAAMSPQETQKAQSPPAPPGPDDFPAFDIGVRTAKPHKAARTRPRSTTASEAASYSTNKKPVTGTRSKRADSKIPGPMAPRRVEKPEMEDASSVIISPAVLSAPNGQPLKEGPHFAQPTTSFARRAGESLRKESAAVAAKRSSETSPIKSTRAKSPTLQTDKRASTKHNKRQSLPSYWVGGAQTQQEGVGIHGQTITPMPDGTSSAGQEVASDDMGFHSPVTTKNSIQPQTPQVRKKTSSYMSPTTATTQRAIATLGEDCAMRSEPKVKPWVADAAATKHHSGVSPTDIVIIPGSPTSDSSGHFESLISSLNMPPTLPPRKPSYAEVSSRGVKQLNARAKIANQSGKSRGIAEAMPNMLTSPSKAFKEAKALDSPSDLLIRYAGEARLPKPLISIPNTTAKRRTSHANILKPIFDKLDQHGLQKGKPDASNLSAPAAKAQEALASSAQQISPDFDRSRASTAWQAKGALIDVARLARQGANSKATTLPPDVCPAADMQDASHPRGGVQIEAAGKLESHSLSSSMPPPRATSSSLRATAQSFEPLWKADNPAKELSMRSWQGTFDSYTDKQWSVLPPSVKDSITLLREYKRGDSRSLSPSKRSQQRFWGELMNKTAMQTSPTESPMPANGAPREDHMPTSFGRAPMPLITAMQIPGLVNNTPPFSPASDDSSTIKTPQSVWTIGSNHHPLKHPYGWKGGDGREISFSGYGPQAEIDPRNPVNMLFFPRGDAMTTPEKKFSPMPRVWPKSQKQWAEYAGYKQQPPPPQKVQPQLCGKMEFISAVETMPGSSDATGYCNHCVQ
ncbi:hypothetical protein LTS14_006669 [Recurvomyces mirabilis]|uniref:uncharacterized protein n=1 Tax=Recurvomyces mirabilis TaxID=574656 RepID=UPI002DDF9D48|nr:hypothetical protein LTS14_006669 [Recurvomyces mirabilis]